ncbi:MAG: hypothetical protein M1834_000257 [Cirrosporium novae-zelandiae]|nr:MAG: hypothetical protein M1834_000257 [Cirrosporium novae-zelandiae]
MSTPFPPLPLLTQTSHLLHILHHRNKNQHHHSHWWRYLCQLRRHISKLILAIERGNRRDVEGRVRFLRDVFLGRCLVAFSNLVADNQFAVLGVVLVGEVGRVWGLVSGEDDDEDDKEGVGEVGLGSNSADEEDLGDVVPREEVEVGNMGISIPISDHTFNNTSASISTTPHARNDATTLTTTPTTTPTTSTHKSSANKKEKKDTSSPPPSTTTTAGIKRKNSINDRQNKDKKKKKRKKGNAIDDIFAALG